jgi:hypothetical protein
MATNRHVACLVAYGKRSAENFAALEKLQSSLLSQLQTHLGGNVAHVAAPGQSLAYTWSKSQQDELDDVTEAIEILNGVPAIIQTTYPVFW